MTPPSQPTGQSDVPDWNRYGTVRGRFGDTAIGEAYLNDNGSISVKMFERSSSVNCRVKYMQGIDGKIERLL